MYHKEELSKNSPFIKVKNYPFKECKITIQLLHLESEITLNEDEFSLFDNFKKKMIPCGLVVITLAHQTGRQWFEYAARRIL